MPKVIAKYEAPSLPVIKSQSAALLSDITSALGVPRDVLASDESIDHAWSQLPRQLKKIPEGLRDERIVRMCVAVATGLFDAALNFIWNATVLELRDKVRRFGVAVVPQILDDSSFDEETLVGLRDAELLTLCLKLNLIGKEDYFFLDQCRATRNNFSAAHPSDGQVDEDEFLSFLSRCQKHALASTESPKGVDTKKLLDAIKADRFKPKQLEVWTERVGETYDAQRQLIFVMLHGIYCDASSAEQTRLNALDICTAMVDDFSPKTRSALVDRHQEYKAKGDEDRNKASLQFFEKIGALGLLGESEVHAIITAASRKLISVHDGMDNFYNEPPFATRLLELSNSAAIPETAQSVFVEAVITTAIGNQWGVCRAAQSSYHSMVKSFSPKEVGLMLLMAKKDTRIHRRVRAHIGCRRRYKTLVNLIDPASVPGSVKKLYKKWVAN